MLPPGSTIRTVRLIPKAVVMMKEPSAEVTAVPTVRAALSSTNTCAAPMAWPAESTTIPFSVVVLVERVMGPLTVGPLTTTPVVMAA